MKSDVFIQAVPGAGVPELTSQHGEALDGKLVIGATHRMGQPVANSRAARPPTIGYARAFNIMDGQVMEMSVFAGGTAAMFRASEADRATVEV